VEAIRHGGFQATRHATMVFFGDHEDIAPVLNDRLFKENESSRKFSYVLNRFFLGDKSGLLVFGPIDTIF
jgi:hypothetical protein